MVGEVNVASVIKIYGAIIDKDDHYCNIYSVFGAKILNIYPNITNDFRAYIVFFGVIYLYRNSYNVFDFSNF